jgi:hypothetical protein
MPTRLLRFCLAAVLLLLALPSFAQQQEMVPEEYTGVAIGTGGSFGGRTMSFDFRITRFTTDQEVEQLALLLKEKGQDALRRAMEKLDCGRIHPVGTVGDQIAVCRKRQQGPNTVITIVTARNMSFAELYNSGRSVDYPFGFLQVKLDAESKGAGQFMMAAKLRFDKKKGNYELESYGNQYIKATNVRPNK